MNKLKFILFLFILLPLCVKPIVLDSLQKEELIKQGIFKLNELKASNLQKIHEGKTGELNFIVNLSPDNNTTDYINDYNLATKPHFLFDPTLEQQLNSRLQQVYVNQNKECYLILVSAFDVEIKAPIPTGLTIQDVFNKGKFFDEQSDIETHKNFHNDVVTQIANNSSIASNNRNCYILSVGAYCGVFFKNENPGCYYYWFAKKVSKSTNPAVPLFEETYDYLNTYLINSNDFNHPTSRDNIAEQLVTAFESAAKNAQLKAQILTTNSTTGVSSILNQFTKAEDYSTLSVAERIHILQVFTGESMGNAEEILTLNILKNTPSSQYQGILDGLKNTSNNFSDNLISLLSWRMDGDNFVQYIQTITIWIAQKYPTDETSWVQILQRQDRARRTVIGFSSSILDGTANTVSYSGNDICFEVTNNFQIPITTITKCSDIYGYVLVKFNSDFSFNERDFKAGEIVKMPALYAHLLFNKSSNDKLKTVGKATLNLVMFTVGVGEISTAVTSYETTVALLDMGVVTTDLIINEGLADTLKNSPEGLMFLDVWNKVDLIYGGVRIATELATQFRNYGTPLTSSSSLNAAEKQKINSMMTEVDDMVVSNAGSILAQRVSFWEDWINKCFPGKNWSNTTFKTIGKDYNAFKTTNTSIYNDMKVLNPNEAKLQEFIEAGSAIPTKVPINQGDEFFKIVPKGNNIGGPSAYYVDQTQLNLIKANPEKLEQVLGLPLGSVNAEYDVFKITYKGNSGYVFKSTVAGTEQFANATPSLKYSTTGGRSQTLILDNMDGAKWLKGSAPIESITPNNLPQIGN